MPNSELVYLDYLRGEIFLSNTLLSCLSQPIGELTQPQNQVHQQQGGRCFITGQ